MGRLKKKKRKGSCTALEKQYVKLDYAFLHSEVRRSLSLAAREVYTQLKASRNLRDSKGNVRNVSDEFIRFGFGDSNGMSKPTFQKAIKELEAKKFILKVEEGGLKHQKAAYAIHDGWKVWGYHEHAGCWD